jgi:2-oxoglutarate dehydrogenase E2 component (dihydrolipoamide succinyltransferase)
VERVGPSGKFYSPLVRNIAQSEGISLQELENIAGSGQGGRVTKKDVLDYLPNRTTQTCSTPSTVAPAAASVAAPARHRHPHHLPHRPWYLLPGDELIEMDRMRKLIADHMVMSKRTSPHVTSFVEADVTNLVMWREKVKKAFEQREGEKLTFTPVFIMAIVQAIKEMPMVNVQVDGYTIIKKKRHQHRYGRRHAQWQPHCTGYQERRPLEPGGPGQKGERPGQPRPHSANCCRTRSAGARIP